MLLLARDRSRVSWRGFGQIKVYEGDLALRLLGLRVRVFSGRGVQLDVAEDRVHVAGRPPRHRVHLRKGSGFMVHGSWFRVQGSVPAQAPYAPALWVLGSRFGIEG